MNALEGTAFFQDSFGRSLALQPIHDVRIKKELDANAVKLFGYLVAGIGFEPMTFGL